MATLTPDQLAFLDRHKVPLDRAFDATGLTRAEYSERMKALDQWIAFGVAPCREAGHGLRVRSGHCVQCKPANLAFQNRHGAPGEVYVAHSSRRHYVKVGSAESAAVRLKNLNLLQYGRIDDWKIVFAQRCESATSVEFEVHKVLSAHSAPRFNSTASHSIFATELFGCEPDVAIRAVVEVIQRRGSIRC
jgi:hypothetical protein